MTRLPLALCALLLVTSHSVEGKTVRSSAVVREFKKLHPCPYEAGDCIADHVIPLACDGPDSVLNLQWQTRAEGLAKDKWERKDCSIYRTPAATSPHSLQPAAPGQTTPESQPYPLPTTTEPGTPRKQP